MSTAQARILGTLGVPYWEHLYNNTISPIFLSESSDKVRHLLT
nr:MAG TPA: hypothetical protein [Caudoviricetes sp.]DAY87911.1 MAG TPA: hypothetical protein [Caudoviricetes sp.]